QETRHDHTPHGHCTDAELARCHFDCKCRRSIDLGIERWDSVVASKARHPTLGPAVACSCLIPEPIEHPCNLTIGRATGEVAYDVHDLATCAVTVTSRSISRHVQNRVLAAFPVNHQLHRTFAWKFGDDLLDEKTHESLLGPAFRGHSKRQGIAAPTREGSLCRAPHES